MKNETDAFPSELGEEEFQLFKKYIYDTVGIDLGDHKKELLRNRLKKRLAALNIGSYSAYYEFLKRNGEELGYFISAVTTNVTSFFREGPQWDYLAANLRKYADNNKRASFSVWSAGCATGEEPYTAAIFLKDLLGDDFEARKVRILATDVSLRALTKAKNGEYSARETAGLSVGRLKKYFDAAEREGKIFYRVKETVKKGIEFKTFNLVYGDFGSVRSADGDRFDLILCRNVMIYFDSDVKRALTERFIDKLYPGAHLLIGHSESLMAFSDRLKSHQNGIYSKK